MTSDPPSQTLTVGEVSRLHEGRHIVLIVGEHTETVELPRGSEQVFGRTHDADVRINDPTLSRRHLKISAGKTVRATDLDSHNGTRLRGRALAPGVGIDLVSGDVLEAGNTTFIYRDDVAVATTEDGAWAGAQALARRVRKTQLNVVIVGNPGSGRTRMAEQILPNTALRIDGRALDKATLALVASTQQPLLLLHCDEIPLALQAPLAGVLESRSTRVVATAGRDPGVLAAKLDFYLPLHRALAGVVLRLPPLDRCKDEFPAITDHLLRSWAQEAGAEGTPRLAPDALEILRARPWPGELRALAATLEASIVGLQGPTITATDLRLPRESVTAGDPDTVERQRIVDALSACGGNQTQAAKLLKVSRRTLVSRLDRYGIARPRKRLPSKS